MNQHMDQMTNEFGDRLDRLERQRVNDYNRVQIRLEQRKFNTNVDAFVADNTNISAISFEDVSMRHGEHFEQQQNYQFIEGIYGNNFGQRGNYRCWAIMLS